MRAFIFPFFIPVGVEYRTRRFPIVTFAVMGICVAVHLYSIFRWAAAGFDPDVSYEFMVSMGFVAGEPRLLGLLTHLFTHADIFHLLGNMIYLFLFGSCVEDLLGRWRFVLFYLLGGMASVGVYVALAPAPVQGADMIPLVGASGAISACMGGFLLVLHHTRITIKWVVIILVRVFSGDWHLPAKLVMSFWFLSDVLGMVLSSEESGGGVAFSAHVGGFIAGIALIAVIRSGWGLLTDAEVEQLNAGGEEDALDHCPATVYLLVNRQQLGPFTRAQILEMRQIGSIEPDALFWEEGMDDWRGLDYL
ncbi:MAG TPA: hypothetical protein DCY13_07770 [Verrucomicrobiales bacterium]|nr:hypothetical protein [Verrucomicrobiales bacterium]